MADDLDLLTRALDQMEGLIDGAGADELSRSTPCEKWNVGELTGHVAGSVAGMAKLTRGEEVDWSAAPPDASEALAAFREARALLLAAYQEAESSGESPGQPPSWPCAELAVHSYDLATALGKPTSDLDQEVAEAGLGFMQGALKEEMRGEAFGAAQQPPEGADAYGRIAAFAGRHVD